MIAATECPSTNQLRAFSLGELPEEQSDELFRHLQSCQSCRAELETIGDSEDALIASLRTPDALSDFDQESNCQLAVAKALGALATAGEIPTSADLDHLPESLGEYALIRPLGRGGMGSVYLARHTKLGREVALKVLAGHRLADPRMQERFAAEMRAIGRLSHPNIVTAHDAREVEGTAVLVTEYIDGFDLGMLVARTGPLAIADACQIIRKVAAALQYTSSQGFVHRDVKPSNIMLSAAGEVKLLDLGLARLQYGQHDGVEITGTGQAMGTADYVAPEQVSDSRSVDVRADIYSLACTLFQLLSGRAPFADQQHLTAFAKMTAHVSTQPPSLRDVLPSAPDRLVKLVDAMLSKRALNRPQTPMEVAEKLAEFSADSNLEQLATHAASLPPGSATSKGSPSPSPSTPVVKPWFSRPVPTYVAIGAAFFGALLGLLMGIVITITYPDGTKVTIPVTPGSHVSIEDIPDDKPASPEVEAATVEASTVDERYAPLAFVVLVKEGERSAAAIEAAVKVLQNSDGSDFVHTDAGTWHRVQGDDVQVPVSATHQGHRFALASDENDRGLRWTDLHGHISAQSGGRSEIRLDFDDELAKRMAYVTGKNLNRQLAVMVDHRIVSAPHIRSQITSNAVVTGNLSPDETRFLMQAIGGGLVRPLQRPSESAADMSMETRLQGIWQVVSTADPDGNVQNQRAGKMAINKNRFLMFEDKDSGFSGLGTFQLKTFQLKPDQQLTRVDFEFIIGQAPGAQPPGTVKFLPDGKLLIEFTLPGPTPTTVAAIEMERIGPFPKTASELMASLFGGKEASIPASTKNAVANVFRFMDTGQPLAAEAEMLKQAIGSATLQSATRSNLKQIGIAFHNYLNTFKQMPGSVNQKRPGHQETKKQPYSWRVAILPYIGENELYKQYRLDQPWDSEANLNLLDKMPKIYQSPLAPSDQPAGHTNYQGFATAESVLGIPDGCGMHQILDGTANTLLIMESADSVPWTKPEDLTETPKFFPGQPINILTADGAVHSKDEIDEVLLKKLITRDGGETIEW